MCRVDYWNCESYIPKNPDEHKCVKDSNIGHCTTEQQIEQIFKKWDSDIYKFMKQLCQIKEISISEYLQELVKRDLMDTGLLKIYEIIEPGGKRGVNKND